MTERPTASVPLTEAPDVLRRSRTLVSAAMEQAGLDDRTIDAQMVVTELVTNALLHGTPPAQLSAQAQPDGGVRFTVTDSSAALPVRLRHDGDAMTGRGLALVEALAARWGVQRVDYGKTVWVEFTADAPCVTGEELDPDALLDRWPDLEPSGAPAAGVARHGEAYYTVRLGEVPTDLLLEAKAHVDNLVREFTLAAAGARAGTTAAVPAEFAELIDAVVHRFATPRNVIKGQALAAARGGQDHVRLELHLPRTAAGAAEDYLRALDRADDYCRAARLLTLESPPQHRVFRRWYIESLIGQLRRAAAGLPPAPAETFEQRLLHELDRIAAAERIAERSARLHALSSVLASAVTPEAVTAAVLGEGVAALEASGGAIVLASRSATLEVPGTVGYGEQVVERLRTEGPDAELPAALALRTREPVWLESREERDQRFPELAGLEPATMSMCAVPLLVGERCLGALRFSFSEARLFDEEERRFILAMASQTAQALDRAQLYAHRVGVSERLQRSLLPPRLPEIPHVRVEAAYSPLGDGVDIGGDFYDVWACGPGRWAFAIGDVSGTGPEAAAMTALVRHTMRALTLTDMAAETVLHQLNRALREAQAGEDDDRFCTVLLGVLRADDAQAVVELVSGGHPGPVLVPAQGPLEEITLHGSLLGLLPTAELDRHTVVLTPGDELILYTDGVTDTREGPHFFGSRGLLKAAEAARATGRSSVEAISAAVRAHAQGQVRDDVALMSLRHAGRGARGRGRGRLESGMGIEPT